jgi:hypothetical protein
VLLFAGASLLHAQTAGVTGFVKDAKGNGVGGVYVLAARLSSPPVSARAVTKANGSFQLTGVKPGAYRVCIQAAAQAWLDPCEWSRTPPEFVLNASAAAVDIGTVTVSPGASIAIHIDDPTQALQAVAPAIAATASAAAAPVSLPHVMLGVMTPGGVFRPAEITAKTATTRDHSVTIPADMPVKLIVTPHLVALSDASGKTVATTGTSLTLSHASTATAPEPAINFKITGKTN